MEAILSNSTRKLLRFEITKMPIAVLKNKPILSFIIIFGTLLFPIGSSSSSSASVTQTWTFCPVTSDVPTGRCELEAE